MSSPKRKPCKADKVRRPDTKRCIPRGGPTHRRLIEEGIMSGSPSLRTPSPKRKSPKKTPRAPKKSVKKSSKTKAVKKSSKKSSAKFPANRKAPLLHAKEQAIDTVAKGADGNQWIVKKISNGSKRWSKVSGKSGKQVGNASRQHPVRWIGEGLVVTDLMKREARNGDLYEDITQLGSRTIGLYGVSKTRGRVSIINLSNIIEWGAPPFKAGAEFPLDYWNIDIGRDAKTGKSAIGTAHWWPLVVVVDLKSAKEGSISFSAPKKIAGEVRGPDSDIYVQCKRTLKFIINGKKWTIDVYATFKNDDKFVVPEIWDMTIEQLKDAAIITTPTGPCTGYVGEEEF